MTNTNNELTDFQKKVFDEYRVVKSFRMGEDKLNIGRSNNKKGCLYAPIFMLTDLIIGKTIKSEQRKRNFTENSLEARELLRQKEISEKICELLTTFSRREILTEEKFVNQLTAALYRSDLASRFVIPENVVLYAMMATEVFNIGLENFCNGKKGDE